LILLYNYNKKYSIYFKILLKIILKSHTWVEVNIHVLLHKILDKEKDIGKEIVKDRDKNLLLIEEVEVIVKVSKKIEMRYFSYYKTLLEKTN
jgi:hypothetical protein